jgi:signal transduction histidine kinase
MLDASSSAPPCQGSFAFPVLVGDEVVAVVEFFASIADAPDQTLLDAMMHIGTQLGRVVERRRLQQELVDAVWEQQRAFGQEIHDTLGQELTGIGMLAGSIARKLTLQKVPGAETVHELAHMIQHAKQGTRRLAKGLLPVEVDAHGLSAALEELAETTRLRCRIEVVVHCDPSLHLEDNLVATHLFRIAQEAVTNAVKHAHAGRLTLTLSEDKGGALTLTVADDGAGILPACRRQPRGVGLRIMGYRAQVIGAELDIRPAAAGGTAVICRLRRRN